MELFAQAFCCQKNSTAFVWEFHMDAYREFLLLPCCWKNGMAQRKESCGKVKIARNYEGSFRNNRKKSPRITVTVLCGMFVKEVSLAGVKILREKENQKQIVDEISFLFLSLTLSKKQSVGIDRQPMRQL